MKFIFLSSISLFCFVSIAFTQQLSWKQRANYGAGEVYDPFSFVIGTNAFVGAGKSLQPETFRADFWEYNPATNVWSQKANFPGTARYGARAFSIGNYGYAGTGWDPAQKSDFFRYDPSTNLWAASPSFGGAARYTGTTFTIDSFGYLGLGFTPCMNDFWRFDQSSNSWSQIASYPGAARQTASSFVISNFAYVGLGLCPGSLQSDFYKYNPLTNAWFPIVSFPGPARCAAYSFSINNKGYICSGVDYLGGSQAFNIFNDFWEYDPGLGVWIQLNDFPGNLMFHGVGFSIGNKGFIGMGADTNVFNTSFSSNFWECSIDTSLSLFDFETSVQDLKFYPNPSVDDFLIKCWIENISVESDIIIIYSSMGEKIFSMPLSGSISKLDLNISFPYNGVFYGMLKHRNKLVAIGKIVRL